jgi:hypothetical protein
LVAIVIPHPSESGRPEVAFIAPLAGWGESSQDPAFASISGRFGG